VRLAPAVLAAMALAGCARPPAEEIDKELQSLGSAEVTAQLTAIPGPFPPNDLYNYAYVLKYKVLKVHRGNVPVGDILVAQYNPLKPRAEAQDDLSGKVGGRVRAFRAGDVHRMALDSPLDNLWMGGVIDKYFGEPGVRYWAIWTNPGAK
jgi:hypothetical protein